MNYCQSQWVRELKKSGLTHWGFCINSTEWEIATPDAWEKIFLFMTWVAKNGCQFGGVSYSKQFIIDMADQAMDKATKDLGMIYQIFDNHDKCLSWCRLQEKAIIT
ncbi:hypothetical protein L4C34_14030 [Vibrio profundum]|uniref:hypothetical protein n=1 Tax=Vibrio profundum TaxID=2910247 RepID=UPI003D11EF5F